jgi:hypothetical protein
MREETRSSSDSNKKLTALANIYEIEVFVLKSFAAQDAHHLTDVSGQPISSIFQVFLL